MSDPVRPRRSMRFRGRSYIAFVLTPEPPIFEWLADLDAWIARSAGFFIGKPVVLDLSAVTLSKAAIAHLLAELQTREIRIMGIEGANPADLGPELPPLLKGGRAAGAVEKIEKPEVVDPVEPPARETEQAVAPTALEPGSLLLETSVRSGQSIVFPAGDVTVLGSVASGAEIIAGGSIHVYGTLRGRAMAGSTGNPRARIFCNKVEAELLAIDGYYRTAEDMEPSLRSRPIQAWLQGDVMLIAPLN
ncbi:MAG: septum site-determining protein MinC [Xanthobacteraceae bacterium]